MPCCHDNHNTIIELAMQRRAAFSWAGQKAMRSPLSRSLRSPDALHLTSTLIASEASFLVCSMARISIYIYIIASEASFLVCSMARISIYIYICLYISGRTSCRKCSKCFYVYLNIRQVRYSARIESVDKPVFNS